MRNFAKTFVDSLRKMKISEENIVAAPICLRENSVAENINLSELNEQFGRYRLIQRIATGGMGEVFLARYLSVSGIERLAVVKRILPHLSQKQDFVTYFLSEGRISSILSHPNVVQIIELGRTNDQYYIAMEYIPGVTLVRILASSLRRQHHISFPTIVYIATQIAGALEYIHNQKSLDGIPLGIIHMDLAPHNVMITPEGQARLLDFGISRASGLFPEGGRRDFRGRTAYLAPEQLDGLQLDRRVDLFALGIIMHEMVMCKPLFRASNEQQTVTRILYATVPRLRTVRKDCPEALERIIFKALRRDPDERYQDASEILQDLAVCVRQHNIVQSLSEIRAELANLMAPPREESAETQPNIIEENTDQSGEVLVDEFTARSTTLE